MKKTKSTSEFEFSGKDLNVGIVFSVFNEEIGRELLSNTLDELKKNKTKNIQIATVPGALEIPIAAKKLIEKDVFDVIIALGVVIKGETVHFEHVSRESIRGISVLMLMGDTPIINGILTVNTEKQARDRISRGKEFAQSALHITHTLKNI